VSRCTTQACPETGEPWWEQGTQCACNLGAHKTLQSDQPHERDNAAGDGPRDTAPSPRTSEGETVSRQPTGLLDKPDLAPDARFGE